MERGLFWLPLLGIFFWLAWAGWNEYQKIEAYRRWAKDFDRHKYDIYSVLGLKGDRLVWGKPTRSTPLALQSIALQDVARISLQLDDRAIATPSELETFALATRTKPKQIALVFALNSGGTVSVPFTDSAIASNWFRYLLARLEA